MKIGHENAHIQRHKRLTPGCRNKEKSVPTSFPPQLNDSTDLTRSRVNCEYRFTTCRTSLRTTKGQKWVQNEPK